MIEQVQNIASAAAEIAQIETHCFAHPWTKKQVEETLNAVYFIARNELGKAVAYAGMTVVADEAYITNIGVLPAWRRRGLGQQLLQKTVDYCREKNCAFLTLEVRSSNEPAKALYKKLLFEPVGVRKKYYSDPVEDAILMTRYFHEP